MAIVALLNIFAKRFIKHLDVVKYLFENQNADVNVKSLNRCPLFMLACTTNNIEVVKYLYNKCKFNLEYINKKGETALHLASKFARFDNGRFLVENGANVNAISYERR